MTIVDSYPHIIYTFDTAIFPFKMKKQHKIRKQKIYNVTCFISERLLLACL